MDIALSYNIIIIIIIGSSSRQHLDLGGVSDLLE